MNASLERYLAGLKEVAHYVSFCSVIVFWILVTHAVIDVAVGGITYLGYSGPWVYPFAAAICSIGSYWYLKPALDSLDKTFNK